MGKNGLRRAHRIGVMGCGAIVGVDPDRRGWFVRIEGDSITDVGPLGDMRIDHVSSVDVQRLTMAFKGARVIAIERPPVFVSARGGMISTSRVTTAVLFCRFGQIFGIAKLSKAHVVAPHPVTWMRYVSPHDRQAFERVVFSQLKNARDVLDGMKNKASRASVEDALCIALWARHESRRDHNDRRHRDDDGVDRPMASQSRSCGSGERARTSEGSRSAVAR